MRRTFHEDHKFFTCSNSSKSVVDKPVRIAVRCCRNFKFLGVTMDDRLLALGAHAGLFAAKRKSRSTISLRRSQQLFVFIRSSPRGPTGGPTLPSPGRFGAALPSKYLESASTKKTWKKEREKGATTIHHHAWMVFEFQRPKMDYIR
jgi:hypothetical protein